MLTKKAKLEQFDALKREYDLLQRFFWDTQAKMECDGKVRIKADGQHVTFKLYGSLKSHGGYVTIVWDAGNSYIEYFDDWAAKVRTFSYARGEFETINIQAHEKLSRVRYHLLHPETVLDVAV